MEQERSTDIDAIFTPRGLSERVRELSAGRTSVSDKLIRKEITCGRLHAKQIGAWRWVRWGDWLDFLATKESVPGNAADTCDRVEDRVAERLRRENRA